MLRALAFYIDCERPQQAPRLASVLRANLRWPLLDLLLDRGEATASALATELPITRQGVAKHLLVLQRADLVHAQRIGRETRFTVRDERLAQAQQQMARVASRWDERLTRIKRIAEAAHNASHAADADEKSRQHHPRTRTGSKEGQRRHDWP